MEVERREGERERNMDVDVDMDRERNLERGRERDRDTASRTLPPLLRPADDVRGGREGHHRSISYSERSPGRGHPRK